MLCLGTGWDCGYRPIQIRPGSGCEPALAFPLSAIGLGVVNPILLAQNNPYMPSDNTVLIWTDGSCRRNPGGPGGWAALLRYGEIERELFGAELSTTNNRMEMLAAIMALEALKRPCQVILYTDSKYLQLGMIKWRLWRPGKAKKNPDLWARLRVLAEVHTIEWRWVQGHSGQFENERVDVLARRAY